MNPVKEPDQLSIPPDGRTYREQPAWRNDFPIDWPQDEYVARRDFTKFLVLISLAFSFGQFWIVFENFKRKRAGKPPVKKVAALCALTGGRAATFDYAGEPCIAMHTSSGELVAYSQKCTHLSCAVVPHADGSLHCPCHNGYFDLDTGRPIAGPPRRPLNRIVLEVRGNDVYATGIEERAI